MNAQERDQLLQFLSSFQRRPAQPRDAVAEGLIRQMLPEGISSYELVQRAMGLTLALEASQARMAQLQVQCEEQAAQLAQLAQARSAQSLPGASGAAAPSSPAPSPAAVPSVWGQGLLRQVGGTAVGVAAGVVAGGLLLEGWQRLLGEGTAAAPTGAEEGLADAGLWGQGDDLA